MKTNLSRPVTMCAIMAALMCILGPMSIPIGAVPISFTNLVIYLTVYLLGAKKGCISYLIYMLLGVVGLPVFSGYTGGIAKLAGPTGGYLVGFILLGLNQRNCSWKRQTETLFGALLVW
ncbi:MAG: biotin transporter BioY [Anaerobutyricum sp.]